MDAPLDESPEGLHLLRAHHARVRAHFDLAADAHVEPVSKVLIPCSPESPWEVSPDSSISKLFEVLWPMTPPINLLFDEVLVMDPDRRCVRTAWRSSTDSLGLRVASWTCGR